MPRFNYSAANLDRKLYGGRRIPVRVVNVAEKIRQNGRASVPALIVTWETPSATPEIETFEGEQDKITSGSPLGRLIKAYAGMGIEDISANEFGVLVGMHHWLSVTPVKTREGQRFQRMPDGKMTDEEISEHWNIQRALAGLDPLAKEIEKLLNGKPRQQTLNIFLTDRKLKKYAPEVSKCLDDGEFERWVADHTSLEQTDKDNQIIWQTKENS